jgi:hypothetical protein
VDTGNRPPLPCGQIWGFGLPVGELLHAPSHKSALDAFNILLRPPDKLGAVAADHGIIIIILDDFFNAYWPDVSTGTARYLLDAKTTMRPFAISPNKVYLAPRAFHHIYQSELRLSQEDFYEKNSRMFGHEVVIFGVDPVTFQMTHRIKKSIRKSAVGPYAVHLKQLLCQAADKKRSRMWARSHLDRR